GELETDRRPRLLDPVDEHTRLDRPVEQQAELLDRALDVRDRVLRHVVDARRDLREPSREDRRTGRREDQVRFRRAELRDEQLALRAEESLGRTDEARSEPERTDDLARGGCERRDPPRLRACSHLPVARVGDGDRVEGDGLPDRLAPLSAGRRAGEEHRRDRRGRDLHATHCQSDHCTTPTPSRSALTARIVVWSRGRPPTAARARNSGKITSPNRGSERRGTLFAGALSGRARLAAANSPYGAPKRRHAITVRTRKRTRKRNAWTFRPSSRSQ